MRLKHTLPPDIAESLEDERCLPVVPVFEILGINKDSGYALMDSGELPFVYINKARKIQVGALREFLRNAKQKGASAPRSAAYQREQQAKTDEATA
jgi:hypothetical protein